MSVPKPLRGESRVEFLWLLNKLCVRIGKMCANKPKKYQHSYGDLLNKSALMAYQFAGIANDIVISKYSAVDDFKERRKYLQKAYGFANSVPRIAHIFLELVKDNDPAFECYDPDERKKMEKRIAKIEKDEEWIGETCDEIVCKLKAVMKYDVSVLKRYINAGK